MCTYNSLSLSLFYVLTSANPPLQPQNIFDLYNNFRTRNNYKNLTVLATLELKQFRLATMGTMTRCPSLTLEWKQFTNWLQ